MGAEKQGFKNGGGSVGGFFHLFDRNGKSRKKLFANKSDLPDGSMVGKKHYENLPMTQFCQIEVTDNGGLSRARGGSDTSCASSITDDVGNGNRAPGVVARLMGLDSLPTSSANEAYSAPFFESQTLQNSQYQRHTHQFCNENWTSCSSTNPTEVEKIFREREVTPQKLLDKRIQRLQSESLPTKSAKSIPITHHKFLSPIKSPGFISPKSATHILEAAAKILDPGFQAVPKGKVPPQTSSSILTKVLDLKENVTASQMQLRHPKAFTRQGESSAVKLLKGQSLNKSWNGPEETPIFRASADLKETLSVGSKDKGKSVSLAIQAKVNVQRREALSSNSKTSLTRREEEEPRLKQPHKSQQNTQNNRQNITSTSGVLRQNNQKQNSTTSRDKAPVKPSISNQRRRVLSGHSSSEQSKSLHKVSVNSKLGNRKEGYEFFEPEKEVPSSRAKTVPRKKRAIGGGLHPERSGYAGLMDRDLKTDKSCLTINEHVNSVEDPGRRHMDVVSFTFTSPMNKTISGSQSSVQTMEKQENICYLGLCGEKKTSLGLNVVEGDALGILLEKKLRELSCDLESSSSNSVKEGNVTTSVSILQDLVSDLNITPGTISGKFDKQSQLLQNDHLGDGFNHSCFSTGQMLKTNLELQLQRTGEMRKCSVSNNDNKEHDYQHPSPVSILEASFSNESSNSSESCNSINGCNQIPSSEAQEDVDSNFPKKTTPLIEDHAELRDSASSFHAIMKREKGASICLQGGQMMTEDQELAYVKMILSNADSMLKNFRLSRAREVLDPTLFQKLEIENFGSRSVLENKLRRKVIFDCVRESLYLQYSEFIEGDYRTWAKGLVVLGGRRLAERVYKEISGWKSMGDWMVDELVERDMSSPLGSWTHFEAERFEVAVEIEKVILSSLIDEVVADLRL